MELLKQGGVLMFVGMATVFAFLVLMVWIMTGTAAFFRKYAHLFPEETAAAPKAKTAADPGAEIAVALAAIKAKRG